MLARGEQPLWISYDLSRLSAFGESAPFNDTVLIAAFPLAALRADHLFVIYREYPGAFGGIDKNGLDLSERLSQAGMAGVGAWRDLRSLRRTAVRKLLGGSSMSPKPDFGGSAQNGLVPCI
jgi:hypothetical protein